MTYVTWREDFCRGGFRRLGLAPKGLFTDMPLRALRVVS